MMPSDCVDSSAGSRQRRFLAALLLADAGLICYTAGAAAAAAVVVLAALALGGWTATRKRGWGIESGGTMQRCLPVAALGGLGMLIGLVFDAGAFGVLSLIALCNTGHVVVPGVQELLRHFYFMPIATLGMVAACGAVTRPPNYGIVQTRTVRYGIHVFMILGMLWGMLWAENLAARGLYVANGGSLTIAAMLLSMLVGMFAGTLATISLVGWMVRSLVWFAERRALRASLRSPLA